jgi:hypothetical protein
MNATTRNRLYIIDRTVRKILNAVTVVLFVLLVLATLNTPWKKIFAYIFFGVGAVWALLIICRLFLSPFVKSDEEEEMEEKVEYILKKHHTDTLRAVPDYSPLRNLTPEQEEQIKQLLRELPTMDGKPDYVYMSYIAQYLTALEQLGKANLNNVYALQEWVEQVTGKRTPDYSHFNAAFPCKSEKKVAKAREKLERILQ